MNGIEELLAIAYIDQQATPPDRIVLDLDATDDPVHGGFFHGYYGHCCYMPLYIVCGDHPLYTQPRPSDIDDCSGSLKQVQNIVARAR